MNWTYLCSLPVQIPGSKKKKKICCGSWLSLCKRENPAQSGLIKKWGKKKLSLIPGNPDGFQDSQALQGSLTGETMVAAATLGSGRKRAGKRACHPQTDSPVPGSGQKDGTEMGRVWLFSCGRAQETGLPKMVLTTRRGRKAKVFPQRIDFNKAGSSAWLSS